MAPVPTFVKFGALGRVNKRRTLSIDVGYTAVQASQWSRANQCDMVSPGFMKAMEAMSPSILSWLGKLAVFLSAPFLRTVVPQESTVGQQWFVNGRCPTLKGFTKSLACQLNVAPALLEGNMGTALTLNVGDIVGIHYDDLNDSRPAADYHIVFGSVVLDCTDVYKNASGADMAAWDNLQNLLSLDLSAVRFTALLYTRAICGTKADQVRLGYSSSDNALVRTLSKLRGLAAAKVHSGLDVDNLKYPSFLRDISNAMLSTTLGRKSYYEYKDLCTVRNEGLTKLFYYSSFLDCIWKLACQYSSVFTLNSAVQLVKSAMGNLCFMLKAVCIPWGV